MHSLLDLAVLPLHARLVHDEIVLQQPRSEDLLINSCKEHILEHLAEELVHLLLITLEFVALLQYYVLDALPVD